METEGEECDRGALRDTDFNGNWQRAPLGSAQRTDQVAGQFLGFVLGRGAKHGLAVDLNFVAERGELDPHPAAMASIDLECSHLQLFGACLVLGCMVHCVFYGHLKKG